MVIMRNASLNLAVFLLVPHLAGATDVNVVGLTNGMAVVTIDGGKPRTLKAGDVTPEKVRLISATSESAVFEISGKRQSLAMGQSTSVGGGSSGAQRAMIAGDVKGHFFTVAVVNGVSIRFLIDTGATLVTVSSADARRAGVNYLAGERVIMQTANGTAPAYRVKLDSVRLGEIVLNNVDGMVVEGNALGGVGLLGMSFLNRTEMKRESDTMTLTRRY
jgi:aspartyl protease family protein